MSDLPAPTTPPKDRELSTIALHGVLAGLCPLIPIPFLDDMVLRRVRKSLGSELLGPLLPSPTVVLLAGALRKPIGCATLLWLPFRLTFKLIVKLFRRLTIVLSIKEALDTASRVLHEGWLLAFARRRGDLLDPLRTPTQLRWAIETACDAVDPRPLEQALKRIFRGSRGVLHRAARTLVRSSSEENPVPLEPERQELGGLVDRVGEALVSRPGYFAALEQRYLDALEQLPGPPGE